MVKFFVTCSVRNAYVTSGLKLQAGKVLGILPFSEYLDVRGTASFSYRRLEDEYACLTSDYAVDEAIVANEYTFTESGHRFG